MTRRSGGADRGELSIEYVIVAPMLLLVIALIYVFARIAEVNGVLDASTRDATRVASEAPDYQQARAAALRIVQESIGDGSAACLASLRVTVTPNFAPGQTITVQSSCRYPISDAGLPGAPGTLTVHSTFSSIVDPNRTEQTS